MASEDLENLLKLFDYALSSDNPAVKKALKNLLLVVSIVEPQEDAGKPGPLAEIKMELQMLRAEVSRIKNDSMVRNGTYTYPPAYPSYPAYPNTTTWSGSLPGKSWTSTSSSSAVSADESAMLKYITSMIEGDDSRFANKDIT